MPDAGKEAVAAAAASPAQQQQAGGTAAAARAGAQPAAGAGVDAAAPAANGAAAAAPPAAAAGPQTAAAAAQPPALPLPARQIGAVSAAWQAKCQVLADQVKAALAGVPAPTGQHKIASLLKCGVLTGQPVEYRRMAGGGLLQLLKGTITADGLVLCFCSRCQGHSKVPNSTFEEHAGSKVRVGGRVLGLCGRRAPRLHWWAGLLLLHTACRLAPECAAARAAASSLAPPPPQVRRPAQFTYLANYNLSLKELGFLVNSEFTDSHISYCVQCRCARACCAALRCAVCVCCRGVQLCRQAAAAHMLLP
jgi:hypothetical protein